MHFTLVIKTSTHKRVFFGLSQIDIFYSSRRHRVWRRVMHQVYQEHHVQLFTLHETSPALYGMTRHSKDCLRCYTKTCSLANLLDRGSKSNITIDGTDSLVLFQYCCAHKWFLHRTFQKCQPSWPLYNNFLNVWMTVLDKYQPFGCPALNILIIIYYLTLWNSLFTDTCDGRDLKQTNIT